MSTKSTGTGMAVALISAATFATSGPFAKSLLTTGWTPGSVVFLRIAGAALLLAIPTLRAMRGRWGALRTEWLDIVLYGVMAVAVPQVAFFYAVQHLSVGVALLLEYLGLVLVVAWQSARSRRLPQVPTLAGVALALVGLVLVLDALPLGGGAAVHVDTVGVLWGLFAATGLGSFYLLSSHIDEGSLPPIALAGGGLTVAATGFGTLGLLGVLPMSFPTYDVTLAGAHLPWWSAIIELAAIAAATSYVTGIVASRLLGAKLASFVGLVEVMFAVLFAWLLLGELPHAIQLLGGLFILAGVIVVRAEEGRRPAAGSGGRLESQHGPALMGAPIGDIPVVPHDHIDRDRVDVTPVEQQPA